MNKDTITSELAVRIGLVTFDFRPDEPRDHKSEAEWFMICNGARGGTWEKMTDEEAINFRNSESWPNDERIREWFSL